METSRTVRRVLRRHSLSGFVRVMLAALIVVAGTALVSAQSENLLRNPSFEAGLEPSGLPTGWVLFGGSPSTRWEVSEEQAVDGEHALKLIDQDANGSIGLRSHTIPATQGRRYRVQADLLIESGTAMVYLDFHDVSGQRITANTASSSSPGHWQTLTVEGTAPAGTDRITVILYSSIPNVGVIYFDNVRVYDVTDEPVTLSEREAGSAEIGFRPEDGAKVNVNPPPLIWLPVRGATGYVVELSQDPDFPEGSVDRVENVKISAYTHSRVLEPGTWYWRYWAKEGEQLVGPSQVRSFVVTEGLPELPLPPTEVWMERIPKEHPRLFVRPEQLPELRQRINIRALPALFADGHLASLLGVDLVPEPPSPYATGALDIEVWRAGLDAMLPHFQTLEELAFLYMMTQNEVYGREGKKLLLHLASMDPSGATAYRNGAPEVAMRMLYFLPRAYTWLYDTMTEEERDIVRYSARIRGMEAYDMIGGRPFESNPYSSHPGRMLGFLGQLSMAFLGEIPEAEWWLEYVVQVMAAVYPAWGGDDGGYSEGNGYWGAYMSWVFDFLDAFKVATGIDFYQKPFFRNTGYFAIYTKAPGMGQAFSDGQNARVGSGEQNVVTHLARQVQNPHYAWYISKVGTGSRSRFISLLFQDPMPPSEPPPYNAWWFRDVGWVALHRNLLEQQENMQFVFKSSPLGTASHSHSDQNAFVLYAYGDPIAISSGYYPWSRSPHHENWTNQTLSKNSLLFDGRGQAIFDLAAKGEILGLFHSPLYDYTAGDATPAYRMLNLQRFTRHVLYLRPDLFLLVDDVRTQSPVTVDWLLHSRYPIEWNEATQSIYIQGQNSEMDVLLLTPQKFTGSVTDQYNIPPETTSYQKEWHLTAKLQERVSDVAIVSLLVPRKKGADGPKVMDAKAEVEGETVRVEITHHSYGEQFTEIVWLQLAPEGAPTLATVEAVAFDADGNLIRALVTGGSPTRPEGIVALTDEWSAAAAWQADEKTIAVSLGRADAASQRVEFTAGVGVAVTLSAPFAPERITVNGEAITDWSYDAASGKVSFVW